jgi:hypothetical protein
VVTSVQGQGPLFDAGSFLARHSTVVPVAPTVPPVASGWTKTVAPSLRRLRPPVPPLHWRHLGRHTITTVHTTIALYLTVGHAFTTGYTRRFRKDDPQGVVLPLWLSLTHILAPSLTAVRDMSALGLSHNTITKPYRHVMLAYKYEQVILLSCYSRFQ